MGVAKDLQTFFANDQQNSVAKKLGISPQYWNDVLNERREVSIALACKLGRMYALNARDILHEQLDEQIKRAAKKDAP